MPYALSSKRAGETCQKLLENRHWESCHVGYGFKGPHDQVAKAIFEFGRWHRLDVQRERPTPWLRNVQSMSQEAYMDAAAVGGIPLRSLFRWCDHKKTRVQCAMIRRPTLRERR